MQPRRRSGATKIGIGKKEGKEEEDLAPFLLFRVLCVRARDGYLPFPPPLSTATFVFGSFLSKFGTRSLCSPPRSVVRSVGVIKIWTNIGGIK